jgi:hypothetical protein
VTGAIGKGSARWTLGARNIVLHGATVLSIALRDESTAHVQSTPATTLSGGEKSSPENVSRSQGLFTHAGAKAREIKAEIGAEGKREMEVAQQGAIQSERQVILMDSAGTTRESGVVRCAPATAVQNLAEFEGCSSTPQRPGVRCGVCATPLSDDLTLTRNHTLSSTVP